MKIFNNKKFNKGFSLVEMIIYIGIFSIFIITFFVFYDMFINFKLNNQITLEVNNQGNNILRVINQNIRNAKSINSPSLGNNSNSLSLESYDVNKNPTVFSLSMDGRLQIQEGASAPVDLMNDKIEIRNLEFFNFNNDFIKIRFELGNYNNINSSKNYNNLFYGSASIRK